MSNDKQHLHFLSGHRIKTTMSSSDSSVTVLAWYSEEEWPRLKQVAADADALDDTYEDWRQNIQGLIRTLALNDLPYIKYHVSVDELEAWCRVEGRPNDSAARAEYVALKAREENQNRAEE